MESKCHQCDKTVNMNRYTFCPDCLVPIFQPGTGPKKMREAIFSIDMTKETLLEEPTVAEVSEEIITKPKKRLGRIPSVKVSKKSIVGVSVLLLISIGVLIWRLLPYISPTTFINKEEEMIKNMFQVKGLIETYYTKNKNYPEKLDVIFDKDSLIQITNPFDMSTGKGKSWINYSEQGDLQTPGLLVYKLTGKRFEIWGYGTKGTQITNKGQKVTINNDSKLSDYIKIK